MHFLHKTAPWHDLFCKQKFSRVQAQLAAQKGGAQMLIEEGAVEAALAILTAAPENSALLVATCKLLQVPSLMFSNVLLQTNSMILKPFPVEFFSSLLFITFLCPSFKSCDRMVITWYKCPMRVVIPGALHQRGDGGEDLQRVRHAAHGRAQHARWQHRAGCGRLSTHLGKCSGLQF